MSGDWQDWVVQRKKEGYSRQEVKEYLEQQGYDPDVVDRYWGQPESTDTREVDREREQEMMDGPRDTGEDMTRAELDEEQRQAMDRGNVPSPLSEDPSPSTFSDTVLSVLSSPAGFFRRGSLRLIDAGIFVAATLLISSVLTVTIGFGIQVGLSTALGFETPSFLAALTGAIFRSIKFLAFSVVVAGYYFVALSLFGGKGGFGDTLAVVLYSSVQLLFAWLPFPLGLVAWPVAMYVQFFGLREVHNSTGLTTAVVLFLPYLVIFALFAMTMLGAAAALLFMA
ncbi:MAG: YIP1 family protein [Candidatus Nanohaloarchaea archaeon]|nr:YIP1 family protein [Candidatus Nanohaloarchaea archaeon]